VPFDIAPAPLAIEIQHLRCLVAVMEDLDLARAADRLGMTEAELFRTIDTLQAELGVELVAYASPSVTPTEAGRVFTPQARKLLAGLEFAAAEARRVGGAAGALRCGCLPDLPLQRLQSFLGALYEREPARQIEVTHLGTIDQLRCLHLGELDLGIIHHAREHGQIEMDPLFPGEPLAAFLPMGHRLAARQSLGPEDLRNEILLVSPRAANPALRDRVMALIEGAGFQFRGVRETWGMDSRDLLLAVAEGLGITLAAYSTPAAAGELGAVVARRRLDPPASMPDTMLAWRTDPPPGLGEELAVARAVGRDLFVESGTLAEEAPKERLLTTRPPIAERGAEVVRLAAHFRAVLEVDDGRTIEVPVPEGLRGRFEVGSPALVYFDADGSLVGWYLPQAQLGVDLRAERGPETQ
jgi:DNA-binding transcriptional LysR family regulator